MVETNALLNIVFALISEFTNAVPLPPDAPPQRIADIRQCSIGSPTSPIDVALVDRTGAAFGFHHGVIDYYCSSRSVFDHPRTASASGGAPTLSTNEAVLLAQSVLRRLAKHGDPLAKTIPLVRLASQEIAAGVPFYSIEWRDPERQMSSIANVEIDGRNGTIVRLVTLHRAFSDPELTERVRAKVFTPNAVPSTANIARKKRILPPPDEAHATKLIPKWLQFCKRLGLDPGNTTSPEGIDSEKSFFYTNKSISVEAPICRIAFTNGAMFEAVDSTIFTAFSPDALFAGDFQRKPPSAWGAVRGKVQKDWQDLADALVALLSRSLNPPKGSLDRIRAFPEYATPSVGSEGLTRTVVDFRRWWRPKETVDVEVFPLVFAAEFDLKTGQTKFVQFYEPSVLGWKPGGSTALPAFRKQD